jgi:hypothetical protein
MTDWCGQRLIEAINRLTLAVAWAWKPNYDKCEGQIEALEKIISDITGEEFE